MLPVCSEPDRRAEVFERELWRIAVEHLDYGEQHVWAALAGARVQPHGWRRARAMLHFDRTGELRRRFLSTAVQRNTNPQLRLKALAEIAAIRDAEAFDTAIDMMGNWTREERREGTKIMLQAMVDKRIGRRDQANAWIWRMAEYTRDVHEEYAAQRWPETKRLLGLLVNSSGAAHARNARRLVQAIRKQDRRLAAALLAAALAHTPEAEEVLRGARTRMARKPPALARELLRNFPKRRGRGKRRRRRGAKARGDGQVAADNDRVLVAGSEANGNGHGHADVQRAAEGNADAAPNSNGAPAATVKLRVRLPRPGLSLNRSLPAAAPGAARGGRTSPAPPPTAAAIRPRQTAAAPTLRPPTRPATTLVWQRGRSRPRAAHGLDSAERHRPRVCSRTRSPRPPRPRAGLGRPDPPAAEEPPKKASARRKSPVAKVAATKKPTSGTPRARAKSAAAVTAAPAASASPQTAATGEPTPKKPRARAPRKTAGPKAAGPEAADHG